MQQKHDEQMNEKTDSPKASWGQNKALVPLIGTSLYLSELKLFEVS